MIKYFYIFIIFIFCCGFDFNNSSEDTKYYFWILYKDYPYVECELISKEQLDAIRYFDNFEYEYITAENTNKQIKYLEKYLVKGHWK